MNIKIALVTLVLATSLALPTVAGVDPLGVTRISKGHQNKALTPLLN